MAVEVKEKEAAVSNRFISEFIIPNQSQLANLSQVETDILSEKLNWQSSGAVETLVAEFQRRLDEAGTQHRLEDPRQRHSVIQNVEHALYGITGGSDKAYQAQVNILKKGLPPSGQKVMGWFDEGLEEHRNEFHTAIDSLSEQQAILTENLMENWQTLMSNPPNSFPDFIEFLSNEEYQSLREGTRPLLQTLHRRDSFIKNTTSLLVTHMLATPDPDTIADFITKNFLSTPKDSGVRDWLNLLSYPNQTIDPELIGSIIHQASLIPRDLKQQYQNYLIQTIFPLTTQVQNLLNEYHIQTPKFSLGLSYHFVKTKGQPTMQQASIQSTREGEIEKVERPPYKMVLIRRSETIELTGDFRQKFIDETAKKFSLSNYMRETITAIVDSLQEDPWGLGVGKLTAKTIPSTTIAGRPVPLRRYRADRRIGVLPKNSTELETAQKIRAVFYMDPSLPNTIILHDILDHSDFDSKYSG